MRAVVMGTGVAPGGRGSAGLRRGISMTGKVSVYGVGHSRPGSIGRRASGAVLLAWIAIFMTTPANASETARDGVADSLNHRQLALAATPVAQSSPVAPAAEDVGILFLRSDGGDPQQ